MSFELSVPITEVINGGGAQLAFVTYPTAVATFEFAPQFFSAIFFLMIITLGFGSVVANYSVIVGVICDQFDSANKTSVSFVVLSIGFMVSIVYVTPGGQHILQLVDFFTSGVIIPSLVILEVFAISYVYGINNIVRDVNIMLDENFGIVLKIFWSILIPWSLLLFFIYFLVSFPEIEYGGLSYPSKAIATGWLLVVVAWMCVPLAIVYAFTKSTKMGFYEKLCDCCKPSEKWGPHDAIDKEQWSLSLSLGYSK